MQTLDERKNLIQTKVKILVDQAKSLYGVDLGTVSVLFNLRGRAAGQAITEFSRHTIRFNPTAMMTEAGWDHIYNNTTPHEVAHLVCHKDRSIGWEHNAGWAKVCKELGGNGEAYHTLPLEPSRKMGKYAYIATCGKVVTFTTTRHNKIQKGATYTLQSTGGRVNKECQHRKVA